MRVSRLPVTVQLRSPLVWEVPSRHGTCYWRIARYYTCRLTRIPMNLAEKKVTPFNVDDKHQSVPVKNT